MAAPLTLSVAGNFDMGTYAPNQLYSGESDIVTGPMTIGAGQIIDRYAVLARNTSNVLVLLDPTQTDGRQLAVAIAMEYINTTAAPGNTALGVTVPVQGGAVDTAHETYTGGVFNPDMLVWPASLTTPIQRASRFDRTNIRIQRPL